MEHLLIGQIERAKNFQVCNIFNFKHRMERLFMLMRQHLATSVTRITTAIRHSPKIASTISILDPFISATQHSLAALHPSGVLRPINQLRTLFSGETWLRKLIDESTGYDSISKLKIAVDDASKAYDTANEAFKETQRRYQTAVDARAALQRELQSLLTRKATWSEGEISIFTSLYKDEIRADAFEKEAKLAVERADRAVDITHALLVQTMKERYQSEQTWSDKIRALSTAGTFSLMALNIVLFLYMQLVLEPKRRAALIRSIKENSLATSATVKENDQTALTVAVVERLERLNDVLSGAESRLLGASHHSIVEQQSPMAGSWPFIAEKYQNRAFLFMAGSILTFLASRIGVFG